MVEVLEALEAEKPCQAYEVNAFCPHPVYKGIMCGGKLAQTGKMNEVPLAIEYHCDTCGENVWLDKCYPYYVFKPIK